MIRSFQKVPLVASGARPLALGGLRILALLKF